MSFLDLLKHRRSIRQYKEEAVSKEALEAIGELTGRTAKEEIVGAVFSRFCVGK